MLTIEKFRSGSNQKVGKERLQFWADNISEVVASCTVEAHAKLLTPLVIDPSISNTDIIEVLVVSYKAFEDKNPELGERMLRDLYQSGKGLNLAAFWAMWARISSVLNRKDDAIKICEKGLTMNVDNNEMLFRAQKALREGLGHKIEYGNYENNNRLLGSVENITKDMGKEQTSVLHALKLVGDKMDIMQRNLEKQETNNKLMKKQLSSFMERIEKKLDSLETAVNRIAPCRCASITGEGTVSKMQNLAKNESITLANESSSNQNNGLIAFMAHSNTELAASDQTQSTDPCVLENNLISFSPFAEEAENMPPPAKAEINACLSVIPKNTEAQCDSKVKKNYQITDEKALKTTPQKAGLSCMTKQLCANSTFADELVGLKLFDLNATETELLLEEYEAKFRRSLQNSVPCVSYNNNLLTASFDFRTKSTENEDERHESKSQKNLQNISDKVIDASSANLLVDVLEDSNVLMPKVTSKEQMAGILKEQSPSVKSLSSEFLEIGSMSHTKLEDIDTNYLTVGLGETVEYTRDILPEESALARKIARDSLGLVNNFAPTSVNLNQRNNSQGLGSSRSGSKSLNCSNFKISSVPLLSPIQDEGSYQSSESSSSTSNVSSDVSSHSNMLHISHSTSSVNSFCTKPLAREENLGFESAECLTLKSCQSFMNQVFKSQIVEVMANSTKVDSFSVNADEATFCILPESPVELGSVSEFELVKTVGDSKKKLLIKNIYGEFFFVNTESTFHEYSINSVLKSRLKKLNLNYNIQLCLPMEISLIHRACSEYCSFINVSNSVSLADLITKLNDSGRSLNEVELAIITIQLILILETVHKCNVILTSVDLQNVWLKLSKGSYVNRNDYCMSDGSCVLFISGLHNCIDVSLFQPNKKFLVDGSTASLPDPFGCLHLLKGQFVGYTMDILGLGCCIAALFCGDSSFKYDKELSFLTVHKVPERYDRLLWTDFFKKTMDISSNYSIGLLPNLREKFVEFLGIVDDKEYKRAIDGLSLLI